MANAVCTVRIMPLDPGIDLDKVKELALKEILEFNNNKETKVSIQPIAFGLKALDIIFVMDEKKGSPDPLAEKIAKIPGVNSAEITDVRRAIG